MGQLRRNVWPWPVRSRGSPLPVRVVITRKIEHPFWDAYCGQGGFWLQNTSRNTHTHTTKKWWLCTYISARDYRSADASASPDVFVLFFFREHRLRGSSLRDVCHLACQKALVLARMGASNDKGVPVAPEASCAEYTDGEGVSWDNS